ncbi:hypothetical protein DFH11DRAFT_1723223 [Phellopilus nigrolimitatus]|nr:hypothetical protein DFH11DRAFT_1723223 [Phellopilus nigrolimitatus]
MATRSRHSRTVTSPSSSPPLSPTRSSSSFSGISPVVSRLQPLKPQIPGVPRRLLVPTSSTERATPYAPVRPVKGKSSNVKLGRSQSELVSPDSQSKDERRWFNTDYRYEVAEEDVQLSGYQIYAVEKWIVERTRTTTLLAVYTGDLNDKITVTALAPASTLSSTEAHQEWEKVIHDLRKDGARPRETSKGVIMVTSLANFRSDYTVVLIPDGDFIKHREQLYVNINLLRMGCSGRSALTLQETSDTTKDRFISMYQFGDAIRPQERFRQTVLELVKLIQCGLSLFDMFPNNLEEQNGLLCDVTVDGIQKWVTEVGEPYMKVEPMERVADPSTVSALISLVLSMRNKLSVIGYQAIPKDPFIYSRRFTRSLASFVNQRLIQTPAAAPSTGPTICYHAYLNLTLIKRIDMAYEKYRSSDAYKLHRVVLNKLDDITSATTSAMSSSKGVPHGRSLSLSMSSKERDAEGMLEGTLDLPTFVGKVSHLRGKDTASTVRYLWSGRLDQLERKRREAVWSDAEEEKEKERERERSDSDEEGEFLSALPWSGKMSKKIENWAGDFAKSKAKKSSVDLSRKEKSSELLRGNASINNGAIPSVVVSRDFDEPLSGLSSGQVSPISPSASMSALGAFSSAHTSALGFDEDVFSQKLARFNRKWPGQTKQRRVFSWSDPASAKTLAEELDMDWGGERIAGFPSFGLAPTSTRHESSSGLSTNSAKQKRPFLLRRKRSYSFDDHVFVPPEDVLSPARMLVDVDLCAQCLIMERRKFHIEAITMALQALVPTTSSSNETLRTYQEDNVGLLEELVAKCQIASDIEEAVSAADSAFVDTKALLYEANFLDVHNLWRMAQGPRHRVFAIRDRVFGARGRRYSAESHGRFNRVQRTLDGRERLVDFLGRTESEVEEESELPEDAHLEGEGDSEDEGEDGGHARGLSDEEGQLQALSSWLLALFTKWGRILGVGGTAGASKPAEATGGTVPAVQGESKEDQNGRASDETTAGNRPVLANGRHHRLSTVGEEDEPIDTTNNIQ